MKTLKLPSIVIPDTRRLCGFSSNEVLLSSLIMMITIILLLHIYGYSYRSTLFNISSIKETASLQEFVYDFNKNINSSTAISLIDSSKVEVRLDFTNQSYTYEFAKENGFMYLYVNDIRLFKVLDGKFGINKNLVRVNMTLENSYNISLYSSKRMDGD